MKHRTLLLFVVLLAGLLGPLTAPQPIAARSSLAPSPSAAIKPEPLSLQVGPLTTPAAQLDLSITNGLSYETVLPLALRTHFEPALFKQLLAASDHEMIKGIVWMRDQADLSEGSATDRLVRRQAIVEHLQSTAERAQRDTRALLHKAQLEGRAASYKPLWIVNAIAVQGTREVFWELAADPGVQIILQDHIRRLPDLGQTSVAASERAVRNGADDIQWNVKHIQASRVWEALGTTGEGIVVANLDSGVDWQHPDLETAYRGYTGKPHPTHAGNWYCATDEGYTYPGDGDGHGTHTMGSMVGQNGIGVAPGARWIAVKIFDNQGLALDSWIHDGFQWLLAPDGNPALAPDVVNNSWGSSIDADTTFLPDVQALRAAGIVPIFSAGNSGPAYESMWSPASLQPSVAVGATDKDDRIALFSSRGPSPWGEIKPEISAPGVDIVSALPGGARGTKKGTSMAAPQVAGTAALMLQANPALSVDQVETILIETARPLGTGHPNHEYGWGLVDAYAAVTRAGSFGQVDGQVTGAHTGVPIAHATVHAVSHGSQLTATTTTDAAGRYTIGLAADRFDITFSAFGYRPHTVYGVQVAVGRSTTQDAALALLPTGLLQGIVVEAETGAPLAASVYVPGAPPTTTTHAPDGSYLMPLPEGVHTVRAESPVHRFVTATVVISAGQSTRQDYRLEPAPRILLVDSGAWYNDSQSAYYERALEDLRYLYDLHVIPQIHQSPAQAPDLDRLKPYDLVIWSAPQDAPGYIGASETISSYLDGGGRLFLSGQDVAYWDGGGSPFFYSAYLRKHLQAQYLADDAASRTLVGQGTLFAGLAITIAGKGGADNQIYPDVIASVDENIARSAWNYQEDGSGGQLVGPCLPYRAVYLAFGLEGVNDRSARQEILRRSIPWLTAPPQAAGIEIKNAPGQVARAGEQATHLVQVRNMSELNADVIAASLEGHRWPTTIRDPLPVTLGACQTTTLHISVDIPSNVGWHSFDTSTLRARSSLSPSIQATAVLTTKTPAPVLLVDGARFYRLEEPYKVALDQAGIAHDYHRVKGGQPPTVPSSDTLSMYPVVVWYTGYDWYDPLDEDSERAIIDYLQRGGRILFSSQDYLYYGHERSLARDYLGVLDYSEGISATMALGETFHPIGWGLGPYPLVYSYQNWSDALAPVPEARIAFRGQHAWPIALTHGPQAPTAERWRTAFLAFPFETLSEDAAPEVMQRTIGWLSWLGASTWSTDHRTVRSGSLVTMTCVIRNDGPTGIAGAHFTTTLPLSTSLVPGSLSPWATLSRDARQVEWRGALDRDAQIQIDLSVRVDDPLPDAATIHFPARIGYAEHALSFEMPYILRVNAPDLSSSALAVEPPVAPPSSTLTYTLTVRNTGIRDALATVTATAPSHTQFTGTLDAQGGGYTPSVGTGEMLSQTLTWSGQIRPGGQVNLRYQLTSGNADGDWLTHQVHIRDQYDEHWPLEVSAYIRLDKVYLPVIYRQAAQ